ncbi:hypothetical protein [Nitrobacter sp. JJSN]|uniref:hypothetical protein n=1 Tax=Nitrobacter sp. JJSN TaxID=3453033 RepID=UPI003F76DE59
MKDQSIKVSLVLDDGQPVEAFTIEGDGGYVDQGINTPIGSYTIGSKVVGGGGEATAHPFDVTFPIHTDKFQHVSARFQALNIGHAAVNSYTYKDTRVINVLEKNMPLLSTLADKVNQTGIPGIDQYVAGVKAYTGNNEDVTKYISTLKTLRSEYAQMLSRGAAVTESDKAEAVQAIPAGLSGANYLSLKSQLQLEGQNIIDTANTTKNSLFKSTQESGSSNADPLGLGI